MTQTDDTLQLNFKLGLKTAIACTLSVLVTTLCHWDNLSFIAPISAFVIMTLFQYQTTMSTIERILGPLVFASLSLTFVYFVKMPIAQAAFLFVMLMIGGYCFSIARFGYAMLMGSIIGALVIAIAHKQFDLAFFTAKYFILQCVIGVVLAWVTTHLLWPTQTKTYLTCQLKQALNQLADTLNDHNATSLATLYKLKPIYDQAESHMNADDQQALGHLLIELKTLYFTIQRAQHLKQHIQSESLKAKLAEIQSAIENKLQHFASSLQNSKKPNEDFFQNNIDLDHEFQQLRQQHELSQYDTTEVLSFLNLWRCYQSLNQKIDELNDILSHNNTCETFKLLKITRTPWLPLDIRGLKIAFKISLSFFIVYLLIIRLNLPGNIQALITAGVISAQANTAQSLRKVLHRGIGIFIGAGIGFALLLLLGFIPSVLFLLIVIFLMTLFFSFSTQQFQTWTYAYLQAAVIIFMLISHPAHGNITIAIERIEGVISGGIIGLLVTLFVFPIHPKTLWRAHLNNLFSSFPKLLNSTHLKETDFRTLLKEALANKNNLLNDLSVFDRSLQNKASAYFDAIESFFQAALILHRDREHFAASILCQQAKQALSTDHKALLKFFNDLNEKQLPSLTVSSEAIYTAANHLREKKITEKYSNDELKLYAEYLWAWQCLFQAAETFNALQLNSKTS